MNLNHANDEELVQQFNAGESLAFDLLVHRFQDRVFRIASVWLHDEQFAADVAQEVFLRSHKGLRSFRFRSGVFTWLYRTTRNVCHEYNRRQPTLPLDDTPAHAQVDSSAGPDSLVSGNETVESIRRLVSVLPRRQREVVLLRIFEELTVKETAKAMGCREGTVKALLHKATRALRMNLDGPVQASNKKQEIER
jgi:RNA polymerase sigma-70 factor (ECF subfamily)